jgi:hypothetical protein
MTVRFRESVPRMCPDDNPELVEDAAPAGGAELANLVVESLGLLTGSSPTMRASRYSRKGSSLELICLGLRAA